MDIIKKFKKKNIFKFKQTSSSYKEKAALWARIEESIANEKTGSLGSYRPSWSFLKIAATVLVVITVSWLLYYFNHSETPVKDYRLQASIITRSVKNGEKLTINLLDGSTVKLNSGSTLTYPARFPDTLREVILEGEAFFEISRVPDKPFVVRSGDIATTVLGTSFNITAYPEMENIQVAVVTGKVKVEETDDNIDRNPVFLESNRKVTYSKTGKDLNVSSILPEDVIAWKDGTLVFKNASETMVLEKLEKWYGVQIRVENSSPQKWDLTARFENNNLDYVLNVISYTAKFQYSIENKTVIIKY